MVSPEGFPGRPAAGGGAHASRGGDAPGGASAGHAPPGGPAYGEPRTGGLRIGDRERDEVTRLLHDAFAQGRITREELDERLDATLSARTAEDLRRVTADLPGAWPDDPRPAGAHDGGRWAGGPWRPGSPGSPGLPGTGSGPYGGPWTGAATWAGAWGPHAGPPWATRHRHGPAWGPAGRRGAMMRTRGGPAPIALAAVAILVVGLLTGVWPLFVIGRLLLVAWLVTTVVGLIRRRHHRQGMGYR
ncbi:DUF1707 domain-containing protein [Microbispora sp. H13382]|uniref:DUF1707 SHOCT-like domain-containing protein n=1 Tax=Microbispora sp. H13382 TaxID=2729112 RepID=UPI0015FF5E2A|nr:DUF1707 domain-containing protein [Microbispora sp. H13382]